MALVCGSGVNGSRTGPSVIPVELLRSNNFHTLNDFAFHASTKFWGGGSHVGEQIGQNTLDFLKRKSNPDHAYLEEMLSFSSETYLIFPFWIYVITLPAARGSCVTRFDAIPTRSEFRHFRFQMSCLLL